MCWISAQEVFGTVLDSSKTSDVNTDTNGWDVGNETVEIQCNY